MAGSDTGFVGWLLSEMRWFGMESPTAVSLPGAGGERIEVTFSYCDPRFEIYQPKGLRWGDDGGREEVDYRRMIRNGGTGWEGRLPFTADRFLLCDSGSPYARIGKSGNLPRLPDDWYHEAEFSDEEGHVVYYAKMGIFNTPDPRLAPV